MVKYSYWLLYWQTFWTTQYIARDSVFFLVKYSGPLKSLKTRTYLPIYLSPYTAIVQKRKFINNKYPHAVYYIYIAGQVPNILIL